MSAPPKTLVYVDGFNLYYGAVKGTPYKWLDIVKLCKRLLPKNDIVGVKYFTAIVSGKEDPQSPVRQQNFIKALKATGNIEIFRGLFSYHEVWRRVAHLREKGKNHQIRGNHTPSSPSIASSSAPLTLLPTSVGCSVIVKVEDPKEKGSDVNLASHLITDAWLNRYDVAAIVSNDSDLATAIDLVKKHTGKIIGVINPRRGQVVTELKNLAGFTQSIATNDLAACQLPASISPAIFKPAEW